MDITTSGRNSGSADTFLGGPYISNDLVLIIVKASLIFTGISKQVMERDVPQSTIWRIGRDPSSVMNMKST